MGLFDTVHVYALCPNCGNRVWEIQTKELENCLWDFRALPADWEEEGGLFNRVVSQRRPVLPHFPLDKSHTVWANQAEKAEAEASLPEPYASQLKFVTGKGQCRKCGCFFTGKVAVKDGKFYGDAYDLELEPLSGERLKKQ